MGRMLIRRAHLYAVHAATRVAADTSFKTVRGLLGICQDFKRLSLTQLLYTVPTIQAPWSLNISVGFYGHRRAGGIVAVCILCITCSQTPLLYKQNCWVSIRPSPQQSANTGCCAV